MPDITPTKILIIIEDIDSHKGKVDGKILFMKKLTQTYEILGFIEDRKKTLIDIKQNSETSHIPCFLADWGYLKESDKNKLSNEIKLLKLGNLGELVAI